MKWLASPLLVIGLLLILSEPGNGIALIAHAGMVLAGFTFVALGWKVLLHG